MFAVVDDLEHELDAIVTFDDVDTTDLDAEIGTDSENLSTDDVYTLGEVHALGDEAFDEDAYQSWIDAVDVGDLASLIYTSGTTGQPKGVRLTHANFRENVSQCYRRFADRPDRDSDVPGISAESTTLSFLPLAHVFERMAGHYMMFAAGATVGYAESPDTLREDFGLVRPTTTTSVPRVYEKLYDAIREQAGESPVKERIFEWAVGVGKATTRPTNRAPYSTPSARSPTGSSSRRFARRSAVTSTSSSPAAGRCRRSCARCTTRWICRSWRGTG